MGFNEITNKLWESADQLRANSSLTVHEYSAPVLGLIFLKYVSEKFERSSQNEEKAQLTKDDFHAEGVIYVPKEALFNSLLILPESENI